MLPSLSSKDCCQQPVRKPCLQVKTSWSCLYSRCNCTIQHNKAGNSFTHAVPLHTNSQYKFIVDGECKYDPNQPAMFDEMGNVNNVLEVHEYVPENLDGLSGFDPPPSPPSRYV